MQLIKHSRMLSPTLSVYIERVDTPEGHAHEAHVRKGRHSASLDAALYSGELSCGDYVLTPSELRMLEDVAHDIWEMLDELDA